MEELLKLYAELVTQREDLVNRMDQMEDDQANTGSSLSRHNGPYNRLNRERQWREEQVIALLGGVIRKEFN